MVMVIFLNHFFRTVQSIIKLFLGSLVVGCVKKSGLEETWQTIPQSSSSSGASLQAVKWIYIDLHLKPSLKHVRSVSWLNCLRRQFALYYCLFLPLCSCFTIVQCMLLFVFLTLFTFCSSLWLILYVLFFCMLFANLSIFIGPESDHWLCLSVSP